MLNPETFFLVLVTFTIAGFVKGAVGLGLPLVSIIFLAIPLGLKAAIAILLVPGVVTNIWQALAGPHLKPLLRRLWSFMILCAIGTWFGVNILSFASQEFLLSVLGVILTLYSLFSLLSPQIKPPGKAEPYLAPLAGGIGGLFYGMTSVFMVPGVIFLQALGLKKNELVQALGIVFILLNLSLISAFWEKGFLSIDTTVLSIFALVPASAGVYFGQRVRHRISEDRFRTVFFSALLLIGIYFVVSAQF